MKSVAELFAEMKTMPEALPDLRVQGASTVLSERSYSPAAKKVTDRLKPLLDVAVASAPKSPYDKAFEATLRVVMAQIVRNVAMTSPSMWVKEATLAQTDVPSYQRQILGMVLRVYPKLFALQLFPTTPFSGPDGRLYFRNVQYNTAYTGSNPSVASGDRVDDLAKFNKDFTQRDQLAVARKLKMTIDSITAAVKSHRVTSEWTYEAEDDMQALYGESLNNSLLDEMAHLVAWVTDRTMIDAALADANSTQSWTAQPGSYSTLAPTEQKAYDETIWSQGILPLINKIQQKRTFTTYPNWFIVGTTLAQRLEKLTTPVVGVNAQGNELSLATGALRDVGTLAQTGIRVLVDPQMAADTGVMGYRPSNNLDPAIHYGPYKPIRITGLLERPGTGDYEQGVFSRFAVVRKDTGQSANSSQLGDAYGVFTVV